MKVALTHSRGRLEGLDHELEALGFAVTRAPLIETRPRLGNAVRHHGLHLSELPWLLFSSRTAVQAWLLLGLPLSGPRLGAVGPGTASALERGGGKVEVVGRPAGAEGLANRFLAQFGAPSESPEAVGLPGGNLSRPTLRRRLEPTGVPVQPLVVYETVPLVWRADPEVDVIVLSSPSAVQALPEPVGRRATLVTLGSSTSHEARLRGFVPLEAAAPSGTAILERLVALGVHP